jgi:hypothetical protein
MIARRAGCHISRVSAPAVWHLGRMGRDTVTLESLNPAGGISGKWTRSVGRLPVRVETSGCIENIVPSLRRDSNPREITPASIDWLLCQ